MRIVFTSRNIPAMIALATVDEMAAMIQTATAWTSQIGMSAYGMHRSCDRERQCRRARQRPSGHGAGPHDWLLVKDSEREIPRTPGRR